MTTWLHFTADPAAFALDPEHVADVAAERPGLWLYRELDAAAFAARAADWGQDAVVIEAPDDAVELVQTDPLDDDPGRDEYFLPVAQFARARITRARYR